MEELLFMLMLRTGPTCSKMVRRMEREEVAFPNVFLRLLTKILQD